MSRTPLKIETVEKPPRCSTMWSGKANTARRAYRWLYSPDTGRVVVMANRPMGSGYYLNLSSVPAAFKDEIRRAVATRRRGPSMNMDPRILDAAEMDDLDQQIILAFGKADAATRAEALRILRESATAAKSGSGGST